MDFKLLRKIKGGHSYFLADDGRIAIADESGDTPDTTDDGALFLDLNRAATIQISGFLIPLLKENGEETTTIVDGDGFDYYEYLREQHTQTKKETETGYSTQNIDKVHKFVKDSLNDFEITQLVTRLIENGNISRAGIEAIKNLDTEDEEQFKIKIVNYGNLPETTRRGLMVAGFINGIGTFDTYGQYRSARSIVWEYNLACTTNA